ncbi:hypothetical protein G9A89_001925 [Geosiphon pyriformis]|nr:hypothetical protein G9A89_001925 [Geosiphon pyriformis]
MTIGDAYPFLRIDNMLDALGKAKFFSILDLETFGAILLQLDENGQKKVIVYASRTLKPTELKYGSTELETAAVIWAIKHF